MLLSLPLCACREGESAASPDEERAQQLNALPLSRQCATCHTREYEAWAKSDHAKAWRQASSTHDAEAFKGQTLCVRGSELHFRQSAGEGGLTLHDAASGRDFPVVGVVGHHPLRQYLVEGERGAIQCPSAAWDVQRREWFDTVADDSRLQREGNAERKPGDWGHWLGRGMTWNAQCASCHVSGFEKGYDNAADAYSSRWREPGVTCIQCHSLADEERNKEGRLQRRNKNRKLTRQQVADSCASCHARREELRPGFREGDLFEDFYRLELPLVEGVFWPNGMQRDEVYTEASLRLSPMGRAGVSCMDCHDAHRGKLLLPQEDNSLCLRCHGEGKMVNSTPAPRIDMSTHTPCPSGSAGALCVSCHMPESRYMARDPRRDHSFNSPDPQLSAELGIPNACILCHTEKDNAWAQAAVARVYGDTLNMDATRPRTRAVAAAMKGEGDTAELFTIYRAEQNPTWKAALLELLARQEPTPAIHHAAEQAAASDSPQLRAAAARILGEDAPQLLHDPVRLVRLAAAWAQLDSLLLSASPHPALAELEETLHHQADQPPGAMQLAALADARARMARHRGDAAAAAEHEAEAERQYGRAVSLDPHSAAARMDFARCLARHGKPLAALEHMLACTAAHPRDAEAQYRLGLILHELGHTPAALRALEKAVNLAPGHQRARAALSELQHPHPSPTTPTP